LLPAVFALAVMADAGRRFWRTTDSAPVGWRSLAAAAWQAATLRYLRGGGSDCYYPRDDMPSPARRAWHMFVAYGFGLCVVSTVAAGISQDILGDDPPYPWLSVPVISGTVGGIALLLGSVMLIVLKTRGSEITSVADMTVKDYGFLAALAYLSASGLATVFVRTTSAYGIVLLLHLAAILLCFASAPYTKFIHIVYRFLALLRDNAERIAAGDR
jgi:citrate/tricarballylate utilization protein